MKQSEAELLGFITKARAAGKGSDEIRDLLVKAGWSAEQVAPHLKESGGLVPPPPPPAKSSGRDIFFYLLAFLTLGISAVALGSVVFAIINYYFPDMVVGEYYPPRGRALQGPLSALLVGGPVYLFVMWKLRRDIARGTADARSRIRRVLTYIALFLASATVIGDVIGLVYQFLAGEVNTRFLLKVLTILIIGGWIIWFYWMSLRQDDAPEREPAPKLSRNWYQVHGLAFVAVGVAAVVSAFVLMGSPVEQQKAVRDQRRLSDVQGLYYSLQSYYGREQALPQSLAELNQGYVPTLPQDPATGQSYEYTRGQGSSYELCATFELAEPVQAKRELAAPRYGPYDINWSHPAGRYCYTLDAKQPKP